MTSRGPPVRVLIADAQTAFRTGLRLCLDDRFAVVGEAAASPNSDGFRD